MSTTLTTARVLFRDHHSVRSLAAAFAIIALLITAYVPILRGIGSLLIVEDTLGQAAAIVALGGQTPFREVEAAKLYHAGLAPHVIIVREAQTAESEALQQLGVKKVPQWELARAVLIQQGVPPEAIVIPEDDAVGTLEELQAAYQELVRRQALGVRRDPETKEHGAGITEPTQRTQNATNAKDVRGEALEVRGQARGQRSEVRSQQDCAVSGLGCSVLASVSGDRSPVALSVASDAKNATTATNAERNNAINALPVILVTSKYHTRRTRLTWQYVSGGQSQPIVRAASGDPFDPESWWKTRGYALSVVREYLGLFNYYLGFPVTP